jgi:hypothetical protein
MQLAFARDLILDWWSSMADFVSDLERLIALKRNDILLKPHSRILVL